MPGKDEEVVSVLRPSEVQLVPREGNGVQKEGNTVKWETSP